MSSKSSRRRVEEPKRSSRVPHEKRPQRFGLSHVIYRLKEGMPEMRKPKVLRVLEGAFRAAKRKEGFRLIAYSIQDTHLHLIVEGESAERVSRGMQGLGVRLTRQLNRLWERRGEGSVWRERFKLIPLLTYKHIAAALNYVLNNALKHGAKRPDGRPDRYSSAPWWSSIIEPIRRPTRSPPVERSKFLCYVPRISVNERPGIGALAIPIDRYAQQVMREWRELRQACRKARERGEPLPIERLRAWEALC